MWILVIIVAVGMIGLSPFALGGFSGAVTYWERLSFIGQTYGAASALLAGLALVGVVATLVLQARETRNARELALRDSNSELLRMAMDNPEYMECWGSHFADTDTKAERQAMYMNMIFSQWEMAYESGAIGDTHLRYLVREVFAGRVGWEFWRDAREDRLSTSETRKARRFHGIIDEEYQNAPEPRGAVAATTPEPGEARRPPKRRRYVWLTLGAVATAAVAWLWRRRMATHN